MNDREILKLGQTQLAYARAIILIEQNLDPQYFEIQDKDDYRQEMNAIVRQLEDAGNLRDIRLWRQRVPLDELHEFTEQEKDLLLDLDDAGGKQTTRRPDQRFSYLGQGSGRAKGAISLSSQHDRWTVRLTPRGKALVDKWRSEGEG